MRTPDRFHSCAVDLITHTVYTERGGVIGQAYVLNVDWAELGSDGRLWLHEAKVNLFYSTGVVVGHGGVYVYTSGRCYVGCGVYGADPPDSWVFLRRGVPMQGTWLMASPSDEILFGYQNRDWYSYSPGASNVGYTRTGFLAEARCDSETYFGGSKGCVYPEVPGVFELSAAPNQEEDENVEDAAKFYRDAQESLPNHPGRFDGVALHRSRDESANRANRDAARAECPRRFGPTPSGDDCDEYPFAATREGAASGGPFDVRFVPSAQNQLVGSMLGSQFYSDSRILDGDPFYVDISG